MNADEILTGLREAKSSKAKKVELWLEGAPEAQREDFLTLCAGYSEMRNKGAGVGIKPLCAAIGEHYDLSVSEGTMMVYLRGAHGLR